jgi:hypothetical protein
MVFHDTEKSFSTRRAVQPVSLDASFVPRSRSSSRDPIDRKVLVPSTKHRICPADPGEPKLGSQWSRPALAHMVPANGVRPLETGADAPAQARRQSQVSSRTHWPFRGQNLSALPINSLCFRIANRKRATTARCTNLPSLQTSHSLNLRLSVVCPQLDTLFDTSSGGGCELAWD